MSESVRPVVDFLSLATVRIELWLDEIFLSTASGFLYRRAGKIFLVTNWHVLSGRNTFTGQPLDIKRSGVPNWACFDCYTNGDGFPRLQLVLPLGGDEEALWLQHPKGQEVDLACIELPPPDAKARFFFPNDINFEEPLFKGVGVDCFIVGFPLDDKNGKSPPIWKRATVASEYNVPFRGKDCFIVDATTSEGMSGSPVYFRSFGNYQADSGNFGVVPGSVTEFAGIYSGRLTSANEGALSLGLVWKLSLLDEMIDNGVPGTYILK